MDTGENNTNAHYGSTAGDMNSNNNNNNGATNMDQTHVPVMQANEAHPTVTSILEGWLNEDDDEEYVPSDDEKKEDEPEEAVTPADDDFLGIAQRTRARHSLNDVALQQLESALVPPVHESEVHEGDYDWEELLPDIEDDTPHNTTADSEHVTDVDEYNKFLQLLRNNADLEENLEGDREYNFEEDLKRHPINEREDLVVPHATVIPQREIHDLIHPEEDPLQYRKKKKERVFAAAAVQRLKPILPLNDQGVRFMNQSRLSSPFLFSAAQLQQLKAQIVEHHQLLIQVFLLTKRLTGHEHVTGTAWDLLQEMHQYRTVMMSYWTLRDKTVTMPPHLTVANNSAAPSLSGNSVFDVGIPLNEIITALQAVVSLPRQLTAEEFEQFVHLLRPYFNPHLKIELDQTAPGTSRLKFTPAEDRLLLIGLERFGTRDWESIHKYILPTKDVKQLINRFKNKTAKSAKDNPIKQFYTAQMTPLSEQELALLEQGVMVHGHDFDMISRRLLPHRHSHILHKLWKQLHKHKSEAPHPHKHKRPRLNENFLTNELLDDEPEEESRDFVTITVNGVSTPINRTTVKLAHLEQVLEERERSVSHESHNNSSSGVLGRKRPRSPSLDLVVHYSPPHHQQLHHTEHDDDDDEQHQGNEFEIEELLSDEDEEQFEVEELEDSEDDTHHTGTHHTGTHHTNHTHHNHTNAAAVNLADNMTLIDGQMIVWTKDEDRCILSAARDSGPSAQTWTSVAQSHLPQRTSKQIGERYAQLMELLRQRIGNK